MAARRMMLPDYGTVSMKGTQYYRTRVTDQQGRRVSLYARTREELYQKEQEAIQQIENKTYRRSTPTVEEYCEKWLLMQSAQIRMTTLIDYTSKVKNYIIKPLGDMHLGDVTADDIRLALLAASKKSASVYKSVNVLYKCIFTAAMESKIIDENPTIYLKKNVGGIPQKDRLPLTDEQVDKLLDVSLDDLLKEGEAGVANKTDEQITLEDLMKINLHNRKMTLLLISGLIFIMVSILNFAYVIALQSTTLSTQYMLYRYIVTGQYENAPIDYMRLMIPSIIAAAIGVILFISYTIERRKKGD